MIVLEFQFKNNRTVIKLVQKFLLLFLWLLWHHEPHQGVENSREQGCPKEHQRRANPVLQSEGILEVEYREEKAGKLPQSHDQCDNKRGALGCEIVHVANANISGGQR